MSLSLETPGDRHHENTVSASFPWCFCVRFRAGYVENNAPQGAFCLPAGEIGLFREPGLDEHRLSRRTNSVSRLLKDLLFPALVLALEACAQEDSCSSVTLGDLEQSQSLVRALGYTSHREALQKSTA
jgi:hypothetical protein